MQDAVDLARAAGVTVVAGTGNNDTDKPLYPASCAGVIGVGATGLTGEKACYSNFGPMVDLVAPGGYGRSSETYPNVPLFSDHVLSTCAFGLDAPTSFVYDAKYGTSMATPHVSGVIALMKAYHAMFAAPGDELTPDEIDSLIQGTVKGVDSITDYPAGHRDDGRGYGMIDAYKAVMAARLLAGSAGDDDADLTVSAGEVEFGFTGRKVKVRIGNRGVEPLARVRVVPSSAGWLTATLAGSTLVLYADRTGLPRGYHEATVTVTSKNGGSETITAKMHKGESRPSDIGTVYVVIHDYAYSPVYTTTTSLAQGYRFSFPEASDGYYWLAAGIDLNNNGIIGEKGDILGCYSEYWMPRALFLEMSSGGKPFRGIDFGLNPAIQLTLNMSRVP